jgi:ribose 5-phosphate isomerase RpiB
MIINKNQLKNKLKENKNNIIIKRLYNFEKDNKIPEESTATIEKVQSNAFTVKYNCLDREIWIRYDNIEIKDNKIIYYQYIDDFNIEKAENIKSMLESQGIQVFNVSIDDKINKNRMSNYNYIYKYIYIINEIIEK